jgi:aquaporin Z
VRGDEGEHVVRREDTVGLLLSKTVTPTDAPGYLVAQVVGALVAAGRLWVLANGGPSPYDPAVTGLAAHGDGDPSPGRDHLTAAFLVEVIRTAS